MTALERINLAKQKNKPGSDLTKATVTTPGVSSKQTKSGGTTGAAGGGTSSSTAKTLPTARDTAMQKKMQREDRYAAGTVATPSVDRASLVQQKNQLNKRIEVLRSANQGGLATFGTANQGNAERIRELQQQVKEIQKKLDEQNQKELAPYQQALDEAKQEQRRKNAQISAGYRSQRVSYEDLKQEQEQYKQLKQDTKAKQRALDKIKYAQSYQDLTREDTFTGQFAASYDMGRMTQDEALAWNEYLENPTEANRAYAEAIGQAKAEYSARNQASLDDDAAMPWVSQTLAGYLPQLAGQIKAGLEGAAVGGGTGALVGTAVPGVGTAAGAVWGGRIGYVAGRTDYEYRTMKGIAFKALLDAGVDEQTARAAANDEAIISSLLEGGDAVLDIATLGLGKGLTALLKPTASQGAKTVGKKLLRGLAKYGINIGVEGGQEWVQQGVSLANQGREQSGVLNLAGETVGQIQRALSGQDPQALKEMNDAGAEGMKIAAMMSAAAAGRNAVLFSRGNTANSSVQSGGNAPNGFSSQILGNITPGPDTPSTGAGTRETVAYHPLIGRLPTVEEGTTYRPGSGYDQAETGARMLQTAGDLNTQSASGYTETKQFGYTQEEANRIRHEGKTFRNLVSGIDTTISRFFDRWKNGRKNQAGEKLEKLYIGKMSDSVGAQVSDILGYDVSERDFIITNDDVKHIIDQHGDPETEIRKGNLPLESWVFESLPEVLSNPDTITAEHEGSGKKNAGKTGLVFSKTFPNGRVVSVQFDNRGRGTLEVTTLYVKEGNTTSEMNADQTAPIGTSETPEPVLPSTTIIPESSDVVNDHMLPTAEEYHGLPTGVGPESSVQNYDNFGRNTVGAAERNIKSEPKISKVETNTFEKGGIYNEVNKEIAGIRPEDLSYDPISERQSMSNAMQRLSNDFE